MADIKVFVLSHDAKLLAQAPKHDIFTPINLTKLHTGKLGSNMLGEGRAFLADLDIGNAKYVGYVNARWDMKYDKITTRLHQLPSFLESNLSEYRIIAPWPTNCWWCGIGDWHMQSLRAHPSIGPILNELAAFTGTELIGAHSIWANDFVCSVETWQTWLDHWRKCFYHFFGKYGFMMPYKSPGMDVARLPAYFYERVTTHYFSNRHDLDLIRVP